MSQSNQPAPIQFTLPTETELREWLDFEGADLLARMRVLGKALGKTPAAIGDGDEDTAGIVAENLRMVTALRGAVDELFSKYKDPLWKLGKVADGWKKAITDTLDTAVAKPRAALLAFTQRKAAAAREAARAKDIFAEETVAKPATLAHVTGHYGARASITSNWGFEITDSREALAWWAARATPEEIKTAISPLVRSAMDRDPKTKAPRGEIPGIRWVQVETIGVR